jgi:hypothetical protein
MRLGSIATAKTSLLTTLPDSAKGMRTRSPYEHMRRIQPDD